jgi:hypothetical protein
VKLRCGGVEAAAFPAPERVAMVIALCRTHGLPLKCTAGLHHPLRHYSDASGAMSHGFFNVFGAGILAHAAGLPAERIDQCIRDERAASFSVEGDRFTWQEWTVAADQVERARARFMTSFGSCSFDEPRADLRELGWMSQYA